MSDNAVGGLVLGFVFVGVAWAVAWAWRGRGW